MAIMNIRYYPDPILRQNCEDIQEVNDEIKKLAEDMFETMYKNKGIGLAGPQVGILKRIVTIDISGPEKRETPMVLINPSIEHMEGEQESEEGCLSFPGFKCNIKRSKKIRVNFLDLKGEQNVLDADELFSICLQHEIDHLNGKLIIDYAGKLKKAMYENKLKKLKKRANKK